MLLNHTKKFECDPRSITLQSDSFSFSEILHLIICLAYEDRPISAISVLHLPVEAAPVGLLAKLLVGRFPPVVPVLALVLVLVLVALEPVGTFVLVCDARLQLNL
jgi:hypothetical protein